ncbi:histidine phosphatase family protein [Bacillus sp. FJAT-27251]|uniref:histidine phosphatase family protein n=1 Tax=Bacillus sp. FJAT-27251 TaxID=1684142 RepID=UPI0006A76C75|nr:histidine phosphatase family protein [Bacillus sp. FJAT-27251]
MQLTLIRHLPTEWNKKTWLQGRRDIGISLPSPDIRNKILDNKSYLCQLEPFDLILASTLKRTQETANQYGYIPQTECLLNELDFGPFEGKPKSDLIGQLGEAWEEHPSSLVLGEKVSALENRIHRFLEKYSEVPNLLVFGHGAWIRALCSYWRYGHINKMNQLIIENNQCLTLEFKTLS